VCIYTSLHYFTLYSYSYTFEFAECLDRLAVALGGAKMMPELFVFIPEFLQHADWRYRLAALYGVSQVCGVVHESSRVCMKV